MKNLQQKNIEFHLKHKFPVNIPVEANRYFSWLVMWLICKIVIFISKIAIIYWKISGTKRESFYRIHLVLEETAEMMEAINNGNEIKAADGLGDLLYVVMGVATVYWLPAHEIIEEVCKSNETKKPRTKGNIRMRDKGPNWIPPNFERALKTGRDRLNNKYKKQRSLTRGDIANSVVRATCVDPYKRCEDCRFNRPGEQFCYAYKVIRSEKLAKVTPCYWFKVKRCR